jgi:hypothetical protein
VSNGRKRAILSLRQPGFRNFTWTPHLSNRQAEGRSGAFGCRHTDRLSAPDRQAICSKRSPRIRATDRPTLLSPWRNV